METSNDDPTEHDSSRFKIDLIVWKHVKGKITRAQLNRFKIDLIVWKLH